jgi:hypothetical protein
MPRIDADKIGIGSSYRSHHRNIRTKKEKPKTQYNERRVSEPYSVRTLNDWHRHKTSLL